MARKNILNRIAVSQSDRQTGQPGPDYASMKWRDLLKAASEAGVLEKGMGKKQILEALGAA